MGEVKTIGIVGGGQLGRMLTQAAKPLGFHVVVLESSKDCPAAQVGAEVIEGGLYDENSIKRLAKVSDVITVEIEHLNTDALHKVSSSGTPVHPAPQTIKMIQNKYTQKVFLKKAGVSVVPFEDAPTYEAARNLLNKWQKIMLKSKHGAYDGRGNFAISNLAQLKQIYKQHPEGDFYVEKFTPFEKELSVLFARDVNGRISVFPVVETRHERSICIEVTSPAPVDEKVVKQAERLAKKTAKSLQGAGVFAIEMFLLKSGKVVVNEIAPRVHNSGHHSIEGNMTSQFEQHIRAITGLPLGSTKVRSPFTVMMNILGRRNSEDHPDFNEASKISGVKIHWYGKKPIKIDRKMGHITVVDDVLERAKSKARAARRRIKV